MILVTVKTVSGVISHIPSPYKSLRADDVANRYHATVSELLYAQIPSVKQAYQDLDDFQNACTIEVVPRKDQKREILVKEQNGTTYNVVYHETSSHLATRHQLL
jgi:hypothetical protein